MQAYRKVNRKVMNMQPRKTFWTTWRFRLSAILTSASALIPLMTAVGFAQLADSPWPMFGHDLKHTGQSPLVGAQSPDLKWSFATGGPVSSPVIAKDGTVYATDGNLWALNPNGTLKWTFRTAELISSSAAVSADGTVYVMTNVSSIYPGSLLAVTPEGGLKWRFPMGQSGHGDPAIGDDGTIYVGSSQDLYAITSGGALKWKFRIGGWVSSAAVGSDGTVYVGSHDAGLYAVNADGTLRWKFATSGPAGCPAIAADGTVYVGSYEGAPFGSGHGCLYAVRADGSRRWTFPTRDWIFTCPGVASDGTVYVGSRDGNLYALTEDGSLRWRFATGVPGPSSPAIGRDGVVYVGSPHGHLLAIGPDGILQWSFAADAADSSPPGGVSAPVIGTDETVYVGSGDGNVYAIQAGAVSVMPKVSVAPKSLEFGCVLLGDTATKTVRISNDGTQPVEIISVRASAPAFSVGLSFPRVIAPGKSLAVPVTFCPAEGFVYGAVLRIEIGWGGTRTIGVRLSGTGLRPPGLR